MKGFLACVGVLDPTLIAYLATSFPPTQTNLAAAGPMAASDLTGSTADLADVGGVGLATSAFGFGNGLMRSVDDIADSGLLAI